MNKSDTIDSAMEESVLENGLTIRPIRRSDFILEDEFFDNLSFEHKRNRFLGGVSTLTDDELEELCHVDYHDSMAFIAVKTEGNSEMELGMARYVKDKNGTDHEMAITLADNIDSIHLGTELLSHLFAYARKNGVKRIYSTELRTNDEMRKLAVIVGMERTTDPQDIHQLVYTINL